MSPIKSNRTITADELASELHDTQTTVVLIDVRDADDFARGHIESASRIVNLNEDDIAADPWDVLVDLPSWTTLRVVCYAGVRSQRVTAQLAGRFSDVRSLDGGMTAWSQRLRADAIPIADSQITQFRREARGCLSYLIGYDDEALVVDPGINIQPYIDEATRRGQRITRVFDTHIHADHVSGARRLAETVGATYHVSLKAIDRGLATVASVAPVTDGDELSIGSRTVRVIALPGHTSDMTGLVIGTSALIGGDSIFVDSVARPDLEDGVDGAAAGARVLFATIHQRIGQLPDEMLLLPCHYCGGALDGAHSCTLGQARADLPELSLSEDAFVEEILDQLPPVPGNHLDVIQANLGTLDPSIDPATLEVGENRCAAKRSWDRTVIPQPTR